jgi:hypothetical protein
MTSSALWSSRLPPHLDCRNVSETPRESVDLADSICAQAKMDSGNVTEGERRQLLLAQVVQSA